MSYGQVPPSLEPKLRELYVKHRERAEKIDWSYHEYLPLDELRADPNSIPRLSPAVYNAVETALLTEINLPWFTTELAAVFRGSLSVLMDFLHSWTAEEDAHGLLLETYLLLGGNGDHRRRMALRKQVIRQGWALEIDSAVGTMAYTAIQELATKTFYLRFAAVAEREDPKLARALRRLAKDETLHMAFYRDAVKAHLETDPNFIYPVADVIMKFQMPGVGMPNYVERTEAIAAQAGYDPEVYYTQVLNVLWHYWDIDALAPTLAEARAGHKRLLRYHESFARITARWMARHPKVDDPFLLPTAASFEKRIDEDGELEL